MNEKEKRDLLKAEYLHLQSTIENFDNKALTIKAWSVTFGFTAFGVAFSSKAPSIFLIASLGSFIFWILEASWKTFQYAHYRRSREIESYFSGQRGKLMPLQIGSSWSDSYNEGGFNRLFFIMKWHHVILPHIIVTIIGIILYLSTLFQVIEL
ncbi:MAG: hypothetical protein MUF58_18305 [Arcicella sp.]|jgi:hypothetical protein|nr:hypothetical protein [Arcicella sp.]